MLSVPVGLEKVMQKVTLLSDVGLLGINRDGNTNVPFVGVSFSSARFRCVSMLVGFWCAQDLSCGESDEMRRPEESVRRRSGLPGSVQQNVHGAVQAGGTCYDARTPP